MNIPKILIRGINGAARSLAYSAALESIKVFLNGADRASSMEMAMFHRSIEKSAPGIKSTSYSSIQGNGVVEIGIQY